MVAKVLVVEDDTTVSNVLAAYLRKAGFDPRSQRMGPPRCRSGPSGLRMW